MKKGKHQKQSPKEEKLKIIAIIAQITYYTLLIAKEVAKLLKG